GRLQDRLAGVDTDLREPPRLQELVGRQRRAGGLEAEPREGVEDDLGEAVEIANQESEEAHIEGFPDEMGEQVLVGTPRPKEASKRDVDDDQGRGEERDLPAEEPEA